MKPVIFIFLFLILVSSSYAYDCSLIEDKNCVYLNSVDEDLIANLIYTNTSYPDYDFIQEYNSNININSLPNDVNVINKNYIKNSWLKLISINPSIKYEDKLYVPYAINLRSEYDYDVNVPSTYYNNNKRSGRTCKIIYSLDSKDVDLDWYANNMNIGNKKEIFVSIYNYNTLKVKLNIDVTIKEKIYKWRHYETGWRCKYSTTDYSSESVNLEDFVNVVEYQNPLNSEFTFITEYRGTHKGTLNSTNLSNTFLNFGESSLTQNNFIYQANFTNKPFYTLQLEAKPVEENIINNLRFNNNSIFVNEPSICSIETTNFFETTTSECKEEYQELELEPFEQEKFSSNFFLIFKIAIFVFVNIFIYKLIKKYWGKVLVPVAILVFMIPSVHAETECGLTNLASCIPEKMYEFILNLINAPLEPLLDLVTNLLQAHPSIELFQGIWAIVVYCISMFYGLLFIYAGFQFLLSGHNVVRREMAKEWLKNTMIMIVLIQGSFYLYDLVIELGSVMSSSVLSLVNPQFFMLTADNLVNVGLEFILVFMYVIVLLFTLFFLVMRYLVVAFGVLFIPIGIFCYFIPPLKSYGKLILNLLMLNIFITFLASIIILACSMLIEIPIFENIKIIVMINCFGLVNLLFILLAKHAISKSGAGEGAEKVAQAAKYIALFV
ncbi:MAG: hypothetical protein PHU51_02595 [Candidatus Nanoarchaeia archaeon]|nr:hypothetical protein [Candidatus Nanoarchaeia archaeon]